MYVSILTFFVATLLKDILCENIQERCRHINYHTLDENGCADIDFYRKTFNISYINMPPYAPTPGVQDFLTVCCGNCTKFYVENIFANISEVSPVSMNSSHFVYRFLGSLTLQGAGGVRWTPSYKYANS